MTIDVAGYAASELPLAVDKEEALSAPTADSDETEAEVTVVISTSKHKKLASSVAELCNEAYGYRRLSEREARGRMEMGDDEDANRVLHLAFRGSTLVGCCSSTLQPPWTSRLCGHWGLLSVHPGAQGSGVASALIAAAERRLLECGCSSVQIEYEFTAGDKDSERLLRWYEGRCGFKASRPPPRRGSEFRCCHKKLTPETVYVPSSRLEASTGPAPAKRAAEPEPRERGDSELLDNLPSLSEEEEEEEMKRRAAKSCRLS
mmetsp:Transcript_30112/g.69542  ORF Transcript_30112/g.69542 Transcript_30112/m.69542 type:complete len:261 (-) Transcript_30112:19-801(-)